MKYEEAKKIALSLNSNVDTCNEYEKAFHFFKSEEDDVVGDNGVVVLKSNGKAINWITFILNHKPEKNPKKHEF